MSAGRFVRGMHSPRVAPRDQDPYWRPTGDICPVCDMRSVERDDAAGVVRCGYADCSSEATA